MKPEQKTRKEIIDHHLIQAGWNISDRTQVVEEFSIAVGSDITSEPIVGYGLQFSDYVLLGKDGKPLAVVEAKKSSVDANIGKEQAKQYCNYIQKQSGGQLPFCFFTNATISSYGIWTIIRQRRSMVFQLGMTLKDMLTSAKKENHFLVNLSILK